MNVAGATDESSRGCVFWRFVRSIMRLKRVDVFERPESKWSP